MEIEGGLTQDGLDKTNKYLANKGLKPEKLKIDYTPYPVEYGREVKIKINYEYTSKRYLVGIGG